jgi:hypothetical protein
MEVILVGQQAPEEIGCDVLFRHGDSQSSSSALRTYRPNGLGDQESLGTADLQKFRGETAPIQESLMRGVVTADPPLSLPLPRFCRRRRSQRLRRGRPGRFAEGGVVFRTGCEHLRVTRFPYLSPLRFPHASELQSVLGRSIIQSELSDVWGGVGSFPDAQRAVKNQASGVLVNRRAGVLAGRVASMRPFAFQSLRRRPVELVPGLGLHRGDQFEERDRAEKWNTHRWWRPTGGQERVPVVDIENAVGGAI